MTVPWSFSQSTSMTSSSTTASSPSPNSTPPNFTDWLHISPAPQSTVSPMMMMMMPPPFQDLSSSARINHSFQEPDHCLHYMYDVSDFLRFGGTPAGVVPMCLSPPAVFNSHHGMLSLDSTTTNLVDHLSPDSLALFPSTQPALGHQSQTPQFLPSSTSLFASSASKFIEDLQTSISPFGNSFGHSAAPFASLPLGDISPVVRAEEESQSGYNKLSSGPKKLRNRNRRNQASSFVQKLRSVPSPAKTPFPSAPDLLEEPIDQRLLSPCKLVPSTSNNISVDNRAVLDISASPPDVSGSFTVAPLPLDKAIAEGDIVSPLTPLTPLSSSPGPSPPPPPPHPPLKIVLKLKRRLMDELPTTPPRRSKRSRRTALVDMLSPITDQSSSSPLTDLSPEFNPTNPQNYRRPVYTNRKLPPTIEISAIYPLFYRRFPASRYFRLDDSDSPVDLFGAEHPGGLYNPPRGALDLYTPRFVKGKGVEKVGLCPICVEPSERGGESKRLWLAMKFSAFNYHMQYAHGISASTGRPFSPPTTFCVIPRLNPGKTEKHFIRQGKCHKCSQWIAVEGIKDMESKVKELHWWKHAAACHQDSTLAGECEYYETDDVLMKLLSLNLGHAAT